MGVCSTLSRPFTHFATVHRGWFVLFFVLPFSLLFDLYFSARAWVVFKFYSAPKLHKSRVEDISNQIIAFNKENAANPQNKRKLCTARGGWLSISPSLRSYKKVSKGIKINLFDILHFDEQKETITVEPMVNMGQISKFLIPRGYTLPVLPELDDLTCGGLLMGVGIESSSHKYGLFNDTVLAAEIVTSEGKVVTCSRDNNKELFQALPWSYGTLGFLTSMTIRVIKCKPYVKMWYIPTTAAQESSDVFQVCCNKKAPKKLATVDSSESLEQKSPDKYFSKSASNHEFDFVESLMYTRDEMITMPAKWVDRSEVKFSKKNSIGLWYKEWFYKHVQRFFKHKKGQDVKNLVQNLKDSQNIEKYLDENFHYEFLPLRHYYHRHTKAIFWELEEIIPFGNHPLVRYLLGWALPPKVGFLKLTQTQAIKDLYESSHVIQDMLVPFSQLDSSLDVFEKSYGIYPLWVCPYRAYDYAALAKKQGDGEQQEHISFLRKPKNVEKDEAFEMYVDLGAYGIPRAVKDQKPFDIVKVSRDVEKFVASVDGFQMLYATSYQDREDFRQMFDHSFYDSMKQKYDPNSSFPKVYDKVCKNAAKVWETEYNPQVKSA